MMSLHTEEIIIVKKFRNHYFNKTQVLTSRKKQGSSREGRRRGCDACNTNLWFFPPNLYYTSLLLFWFWNTLVTFEIFAQIDEKTWPDQQKRQRHSESTFKERSLRFVTFETFDQCNRKTSPDQKKRRQRLIENTFILKTNTFREHLQRAIF